jgi:hypothetical protein
VNAGATISGAATVESTPVSRDDLGVHCVSLGSSVSISPAIGWGSTVTTPIPASNPHHARPHQHGDGADELTGPDFDPVTADGANHAYIGILTGG